MIAAEPEFAAAAGVRLLRGRWFTPNDDAAGARVAAVSETLARSVYQTTDVVGRDMLVYGSVRRAAAGIVPLQVTIVGVTADPPASGIIRIPQAVLFEPFAQRAAVRHVLLTARADTSGRAVTELRAAIRQVDSDLALSSAGPASVMLAGPLVTLRLIAALSSALGTLALVLAMAGLFGVLSHVVARRTREIGIRLAVGASRRQIFRLVLRDGLGPVLEGLALGFAIGVALRIILRASIHTAASPVDGWLLALVPLPFAAAALAACSAARRAGVPRRSERRAQRSVGGKLPASSFQPPAASFQPPASSRQLLKDDRPPYWLAVGAGSWKLSVRVSLLERAHLIVGGAHDRGLLFDQFVSPRGQPLRERILERRFRNVFAPLRFADDRRIVAGADERFQVHPPPMEGSRDTAA